MEFPKEEESALDHAEHELYDPKNKMDDISIHKAHDTKVHDIPTSWGETTPIIAQATTQQGLSLGMKLFIGSAILLIAALSFTAWRVLSSRNVVSAANIDMSADIDAYLEGGEATPLTLSLQNRNTQALEDASVTLVYKQGTGAQDEQEKVHEKRSIGTLGAGEYKREDFQVTLYGSEAEQRDITLKLEYKVAGSNAVFSKTTNVSVVLKTPPVAVSIQGPSILSVGQSGAFTVTVKNNTSTTSLPSVLALTLPNTFVLENASPRPAARGSVWAVPALSAGMSQVINISGNISGTQGETTTIVAQLGSVGDTLTSIGFVYAKQTFDINLRSSPLVLSIDLTTERGTTDSLRYGDKTTLVLNYENTSDSSLQSPTFTLAVEGQAALYKQINPIGGYYDSTKQTITWNMATLPELTSLAPHAKGELRVIIPIILSGTNSPKLSVTYTGIGTSKNVNDVVASATKSWVVQGSASLSGRTYYKNSPFPNTGPIPPKPNTDTTYTAHLSVSAQNALVNGKVSFILPAYVTWRNITSDNAKIAYDSKTRTVTWTFGSLDAGKSVNSDIGLSIRPSQSQVNQIPPITSGIVLDADEAVSKAHIHMTIPALTTLLTGEGWAGDPSRVVDQ